MIGLVQLALDGQAGRAARVAQVTGAGRIGG
jgi:hypothetical protein